MAVPCPFCNLLFSFSEYLHHECRAQNQQAFTPANTNDVLMSQNISDAIQILDEIPLVNLSVSEEQMEYMVSDLYNDEADLGILDYNENKSRDEKLNERGATLPDLNKFTNYRGILRPSNQENLERNLNEPCISFGIRDQSENNAQSNVYFPMESPEFNEEQFSNMEINLRFDRNQPSVPDSIPQQTRFNQFNLNPNKYSERNPRNSDSVIRSSRVYEEPKEGDVGCAGERDSNILESHSGRDVRDKLLSPQSSNTCSTNTEVSIGIHCPECKRVFLEYEPYVNHRFGNRGKCILNEPSTSPGVRQWKKKIKQNSERKQRNLDSIGGSNAVHEDPKHDPDECPIQRAANLIISEAESDAQIITAASNSSLVRCSGVHSEEAKSQQNIPGRPFRIKESNITKDKKRNRSGSVSEGIHESSVDNSFSANPKPVQHPANDTGEEPHVCEICKKRFQTKHHLKIHQQCHSEDRPHKCDVCGKGFALKCGLKEHLTNHSDKRPYGCESCGYTFKRKFHLSQHRMTHTDPCACKYCGKECINKLALKRHRCPHTKS
ncbi:hypothetical protein TNCT_283581 [Trichonephila clavata]|uniref:C2H2-type domain-containing protein n=1 Tax=Trichonephila clavata TaxID=2740835 RepID=A0A8X6HTV1_TRICU|nr:hypothetical protein TNCT_283581 [Trichonephila clavata]